jgi:hypothetical protein
MPKAGSKAARAGIYECTYCGEEITLRRGTKIPPCRCRNGDWRVLRATTPAPRKKRRKKRGGFLDSIFG